jgi:hypothetical protein
MRSRPKPGYVFEAWLEDKSPLHTRRDLMERAEVIEGLRRMAAMTINLDASVLQAAADLLENRWGGFFEDELLELRAGALLRRSSDGSKAVPCHWRELAGRLVIEIRQELDCRETKRANYRGPGIYRGLSDAEYEALGLLDRQVVLRCESGGLDSVDLAVFNERPGGGPRYTWVREA